MRRILFVGVTLIAMASFAADPSPGTPANEAKSEGSFVDDVEGKRVENSEKAAQAMEEQRSNPTATPTMAAKPQAKPRDPR